ncbi:hypothetical protein FHS97_002654 [Sphingomonas endophytica]|uniref:Uncharacterized protein n=1 Tax=Sphingomonas endophytica TaxID=869719 RepID=A0ABR6N7C3_9SPHN|nr:hypothetical protein [Sphingomonas endophytica]
MTSADMLRVMREGDVALAQCEARRRLLADAWPR